MEDRCYRQCILRKEDLEENVYIHKDNLLETVKNLVSIEKISFLT